MKVVQTSTVASSPPAALQSAPLAADAQAPVYTPDPYTEFLEEEARKDLDIVQTNIILRCTPDPYTEFLDEEARKDLQNLHTNITPSPPQLATPAVYKSKSAGRGTTCTLPCMRDLQSYQQTL